MSASRYMPLMFAIGVGVVSGLYIWDEPLQRETGRLPPALDEETLKKMEEAKAAQVSKIAAREAEAPASKGAVMEALEAPKRRGDGSA